MLIAALRNDYPLTDTVHNGTKPLKCQNIEEKIHSSGCSLIYFMSLYGGFTIVAKIVHAVKLDLGHTNAMQSSLKIFFTVIGHI